MAIEAYGPQHLALIRFLSASALFGAYALVTRMRMPPVRDWHRFALLGLCAVTIYHTALNFGEQTVPAGTASLIIATVPVFSAIFSRWFLRERLTGIAWAGLALSLFGIFVMTLGGEREVGFTTGVIYVAVAAVSGATYFVFVKPMLTRYDPIDSMAYVTWAGTLPLLLFAPGFLGTLRSAPLESTLVAIYIGVFPAGIAYASWSIALARLPVSRVAPFMYLVSPLAILWGWLWAGEVPTLVTLLGGFIALAGVVVVQVWGRRPLAAPPAAPSSHLSQ